MPRELEARYRRRWLVGPMRAQIWDGKQWIWLSKVGTERQRKVDALRRNSNAILKKVRNGH